MRVIAGEYKGQLIKMPKGVKIRPTAEKVKESLFSILGEDISGTSFLELFAGSGNVGIEAASRGAELVVFAESNRSCVKTIAENLRRIGIAYSYGAKSLGAKNRDSTIVLPLDAERTIRLLAHKRQKFDFVFLDPPYHRDQLKNCLIKICRCDILRPQSWVVAEHERGAILPHLFDGFRVMLTKHYGDTTLSFYCQQK